MRRLIEAAVGLGLACLAAGAVLAEPAPPRAAPVEPAAAAHAEPVTDYTLQATLDPLAHTLDARGTIRLRNTSRAALSELWVHLYLNAFASDRTVFMRFDPGSFRGQGELGAHGSIDVKRFAVEGVDLWPGADKTSSGEPEDATDIRVPLAKKLQPGEALDIDVAFTAQLPALLFRTGHFGAFHMVAQWFPKIARLEPDGTFTHFPFHRLSEFYADFGRYDVTLDTPAQVVVGATGKLVSEEREGARARRRFVQEDVHDFAFTAWDGFRELAARSEDGVAIRVLFPPGFEAAADAELASARAGLRHFGEAYGRYPYETLTIVHPPPGAEEAGGMEYPTLITTGGPWFLPWTGVRGLEMLTVHELGHQWFYGLVATDEHHFPFLDEGVNSFAEIDAMEALYPGGSAAELPGLSIGYPAVSRAVAAEAARDGTVARAAPAFPTGSDYGALVYQRTATILLTLDRVYVAGGARRAVGRYGRAQRFQHPKPEALLDAVRAEVGTDAAEQLRVALFEGGTVDYAASDLRSSPSGSGFVGSVLVRRRGTLRFPVDVDLVAKDGSSRRVRWDAAEATTRLSYEGPSPLVAAVIDPEHRVLLDDDLSNNAVRTKPRRLSGALLDQLWFAGAAALGGALP